MRKIHTRKITSLLLIAAIVLAMVPGLTALAATDTAGHWAEPVIDKWSAYGVLDGYPDGSFKPEDSMTRGEFFKVLDTAFKFKGTTANPFSDMNASDWYYDNVISLYAAGIINGAGGRVNADGKITREQVFVVFARLLDLEPDASALSGFVDSSLISDWARDEVSAIVAAGYVEGSDGRLNPQAAITRSEVVQVLDNCLYDYGDFEAAKARAIAAIKAAGIDLASLEGKTIVIPGQEITAMPEYENPIFGQMGKAAEVDDSLIPFTNWPDVGTPAIAGEYGSKPATGVFAQINLMLAYASDSYDITKDDDFADFLAFADMYTTAAVAGTPVGTKTVYFVSTAAGDLVPSSEDTNSDFKSSQPYRIYTQAIEIGVGPQHVRVLDSIPASSPMSLGPRTYESISNLVYTLGINNEGIAVTYDRIPTDLATSYGAPSNGKMRVGYFTTEVFEIADGAKAYFVTPGNDGIPMFGVPATPGAVEATPVSLTSLAADWNDQIRVVFNSAGQISEAYIVAADGAGEAPENYEDIAKLEFVYGVKADDPDFGYNGVENPYPVDYMLYDPVRDGGDADANYPLFIFLHGIGGGTNKETPLGGDGGIGLRYMQSDYQGEFETDKEGVYGAYVMLPRANEHATHDLGTQGWLHGYREDTNPMYALGDESYKGRSTQVAALIADIEQLIATRNIDPDRIYLTGFSAGGYMAWQTLLEGGDLFAAASPQGAAFFPEGSQLASDYSENDLGLTDRLLAVKDVPIWLIHARNDGTCAWDITTGDAYKSEDSSINGQNTLWGVVRSFSDGVSAVQGSPLTRVTVHNYLKTGAGDDAGQHSPMLMMYNNVYDDGLTVDGVTLDYFDRLYGEKPDDYDEANPTGEGAWGAPPAHDNQTGILYAYGINPDYSTADSWGDTFISWLNACGAAKAAS